MTSIYDKILALHGPAFLRKSALNIRKGGGVFERVLSGQGIKTALEIGTYRGVAAAEMSQYVERVITIDLAFGKLELNGTNFDRLAFWQSLDVHNIGFVAVRDDVEKEKLIADIEFDFAFIDGAHDGDAAARDFELVKHCGRVLFHDYDCDGVKKKDAVYEFVNSLPKEQVLIDDIFAYYKKDGHAQ